MNKNSYLANKIDNISFEEFLLNEKYLSKEDIEYVLNSFEEVHVKKSEFIIEEGEQEDYLYYIEKGAFRYWITNELLRDITFWFSFEGEFMNSYLSFVKGVKSEYNIQALSDAKVWRVHKKWVDKAYMSSLGINILARKMLEDILSRKVDREIELLKLKPEERYKNLLKTPSNTFNTVPLKYIASYLGVTPQSLSRIRKRII